MVQIELLHVRNFQNALIEVLYSLIPEHCSALLRGLLDDIHINRMIDDICHQLFQNALINAREDFCLGKLFNRKLTEPCRKAQFILGLSCNTIKLSRLIRMHPLRHEIVAVALMRDGDKTVQSDQIIHAHGACCCGHQDMTGEPAEIRCFFTVTGNLSYHLPEDSIRTIFHQ